MYCDLNCYCLSQQCFVLGQRVRYFLIPKSCKVASDNRSTAIVQQQRASELNILQCNQMECLCSTKWQMVVSYINATSNTLLSNRTMGAILCW